MTNVTQMNETDRQYYFMEKASGHVAKLGEELGRSYLLCDYFRVSDECQGFGKTGGNPGKSRL